MPIADVTVSLVSGAVKDSAAVVNSVVAPPVNGLCIGFSGVDNARQVEIVQCVKMLRDKLIEGEFMGDQVSQLAEMVIGDTKDQAVVATPPTSPISGTVFIITGDEYPKVGNVTFHGDVATAIRALSDKYLKSV